MKTDPCHRSCYLAYTKLTQITKLATEFSNWAGMTNDHKFVIGPEKTSPIAIYYPKDNY